MSSMGLKLAKTHDYCGTDDPCLTVVLIHGIASDSSTFSGLLECLEKTKSLRGVRFVTFDLLGSGKSLKDDKLNYDYDDQILALNNSITGLKSNVPLVLVGHSLGTFIVTRYASKHPNSVKKLVLISPPVFTEKDLDNPDFMIAIQAFKDLVGARNPDILKEKSFNNSMDKIVLDRKNYETLVKLNIPTELVYGGGDQLIASYNIPKLLKDSDTIIATKTQGKHSVTQDKYARIIKILEETINVKDI